MASPKAIFSLHLTNTFRICAESQGISTSRDDKSRIRLSLLFRLFSDTLTEQRVSYRTIQEIFHFSMVICCFNDGRVDSKGGAEYDEYGRSTYEVGGCKSQAFNVVENDKSDSH